MDTKKKREKISARTKRTNLPLTNKNNIEDSNKIVKLPWISTIGPKLKKEKVEKEKTLKQDKIITNYLSPSIRIELCFSFYFGETKKKTPAAEHQDRFKGKRDDSGATLYLTCKENNSVGFTQKP